MERETTYQCRHCKEPLGVSSGKVLSVGSIKIIEASLLKCAACGRKISWRPRGKETTEEPMPTPVYAV